MTEKGPRWLKSVGGYSTDEQWMGVLFVEVISRDIIGDYDCGGGKQVIREGNKERRSEREGGRTKGRRGEREERRKRGGVEERRGEREEVRKRGLEKEGTGEKRE
ncbi:hypothetical protein LSTR_LSTR011724 [Laodelphax striatellus]|uniref:Uncharacterized protein n=1 Tax=Laodelphax striatellus TaxID=195883 RepID=A0A482WMN2_LAOST|nr:hypothetical protein LSTR_LSTR011724 [Laodelphax striatellus]